MEYEVIIRLKIDPTSSYFGIDQMSFDGFDLQSSKSDSVEEMVKDALYDLDDVQVTQITAEEI